MSVINSAASGIASRTFHPYFNDVNPVKRQAISLAEQNASLASFKKDLLASKKRLTGKTILRDLTVKPFASW